MLIKFTTLQILLQGLDILKEAAFAVSHSDLFRKKFNFELFRYEQLTLLK